jgi:hypothetical protein
MASRIEKSRPHKRWIGSVTVVTGTSTTVTGGRVQRLTKRGWNTTNNGVDGLVHNVTIGV